jgi:hypothetical protein
LLGHPCESGGAAFEVRAERRKDIVLEDIVVRRMSTSMS